MPPYPTWWILYDTFSHFPTKKLSTETIRHQKDNLARRARLLNLIPISAIILQTVLDKKKGESMPSLKTLIGFGFGVVVIFFDVLFAYTIERNSEEQEKEFRMTFGLSKPDAETAARECMEGLSSTPQCGLHFVRQEQTSTESFLQCIKTKSLTAYAILKTSLGTIR